MNGVDTATPVDLLRKYNQAVKNMKEKGFERSTNPYHHRILTQKFLESEPKRIEDLELDLPPLHSVTCFEHISYINTLKIWENPIYNYTVASEKVEHTKE